MTQAQRPQYDLIRQRAWLLEHFRADRDVLEVPNRAPVIMLPGGKGVKPMCRCWCCGKLLGERALFVSKIDPAGTTRRNNIRPACADHATLTTSTLRESPTGRAIGASLRESFERRS